MNTLTKFASVTVVALLLGTSLASAFDGAPIDVTPYDPTPVDMSGGDSYDPTPVDLPFDPTPIDIQTGPISVDGDYTPINVGGGKSGKGGTGTGPHGELVLAFACRAGGEDLVVTNKGEAVPAGTKVKWQVRAADETGYFLLKNGLAVDERVRVSDVLDLGVDAGTDCVAKAI